MPCSTPLKKSAVEALCLALIVVLFGFTALKQASRPSPTLTISRKVSSGTSQQQSLQPLTLTRWTTIEETTPSNVVRTTKSAESERDDKTELLNANKTSILGAPTLNVPSSCFIHVGKTGGSAIGCVVGRPTGVCKIGSKTWNEYESYRESSVISQAVIRGGFAHMKDHHCKKEPGSFLVPIRNPISRIISWFYYEKTIFQGERNASAIPRGNLEREKAWVRSFLFTDCYQDLGLLAVQGLGHSDADVSSSSPIPADVRDMTCPQRAWAAITGARRFVYHNWYNYEYYYDLIVEEMERGGEPLVFVLRNEQLAEDWDSVDQMLGGNGKMGKILYGSTKLRASKKPTLPPAAIALLCDALCIDIQYYKRILLKAANLDAEQVAVSISNLQELCPNESIEIRTMEDCPAVPSFVPPSKKDIFIGNGKKRFISTTAVPDLVQSTLQKIDTPQVVSSALTDIDSDTSFVETSTATERKKEPKSESEQHVVSSTSSFGGTPNLNVSSSCFIHVGKTAGSAIGCIVGQPTDVCKIGSKTWNMYKPYRESSVIAQAVMRGGHAHMNSNRCRRKPDSFLVPIRNPITRIISWFYYEGKGSIIADGERNASVVPKGNLKKEKAWIRSFLFADCYQNLAQLSVQGLGHSDADVTSLSPVPADVRNMTCPQRAWAAITGARRFAYHNWYNYEYYYELIMREMERGGGTSVFVLRNEHLAEDWDSVDHMLGGNGTMGGLLFGAKLRATEKPKLPPSAIPLLCNALCIDIQYYKRILLKAANLDATQVALSISSLQELCPNESIEIRSMDECPAVPTFPPPSNKFLFLGTGKSRYTSTTTTKDVITH